MEEKELFYKRNSETNDSTNNLKYHIWKFVDAYLFKTSLNCMSRWRVFLLRLFGAKIGKGCYIASKATITKPWNFEMGNISAIDEYCYIIPPIKIGDYVSIGNNCHLIAGGHDIWSRGFETRHKTISIGNCAFIGAGTYIGIGCNIGQMSVIGAHSYIVKDVQENTVVTMYPMKQIACKRLKEEEYGKYRYHFNN